MFGVSGAELMVILLVGLIVLGPDRLPGVARKAGQVMGDLRRVSSGFEAEVRTALFEAEQPERYRPGTAAGSVVDPPASAAPVEDNGDPASDPAEQLVAEAPAAIEPTDGPVPGGTDFGEPEPRDPAS